MIDWDWYNEWSGFDNDWLIRIEAIIDSDQKSWLNRIETMNDSDLIMIDWIWCHDLSWLKSWLIRIEAMIDSDQ